MDAAVSWRSEACYPSGWKRGRPWSVKRREVITLFGGAAAAWPLAARAKQPGKRPIVGFLGDSTSLGESERAAAFTRRLYELGWIEGRTIAIEYRWADGRSERLVEIAAEFVRLNVDMRRNRPGGRAAEQRDELAAVHSITSSVRASSEGGTSRSRADWARELRA